MNIAVKWIEFVFTSIPLPLLEVWGRFGYILGFLLMIFAFGGFTFRPGGNWGFGRERQTWDMQALLSILITFVLIFATGYIGSFFVLVPGAQTFESLKDLSVFLCILLFGYPALLAVPFAYGLSDLMEGVPPHFLLDWIFGYFINPACFWVAYQLIGRDPDFKKIRTWGLYFIFIILFMSIEPQLWGYICSGKFTSEISYRNITPALFFTTSVTWIIAPFAMLLVFPIVKKYKMYWAEIPDHMHEFTLNYKNWTWERSNDGLLKDKNVWGDGLPVRMFIVTPFILLVLFMVGTTAFVTLNNAESTADKLAGRLHQEVSENINLLLDDYLQRPGVDHPKSGEMIHQLLKKSSIAEHGRAFVIDRSGKQIASSKEERGISDSNIFARDSRDIVVSNAVQNLTSIYDNLQKLNYPNQFHFDIVVAKPLSRETWLAQATPYQDNSGKIDWIVITVMPESFYLEGVREGNSQSAMVFAVALILCLLVAAFIAGIVTAPLRTISNASRGIASGDLGQRVSKSPLQELNTLSLSFNFMAEQLEESFRRTKENEATILDLNANLEKKIDIRTEELKKSNRDLVEAVSNLEKIMKELKETQAQLLLSEKLAALGQLAAGMTHELNTPLGAILSSNRAIADILSNEMKKIPALLSNWTEKDSENFSVLLEEGLREISQEDILPSRIFKKEMLQKLKDSDIPNYESVANLIFDAGLYRLGDKLPELLKTEKSFEILKTASSFASLIRFSNVISIATGKASYVVEALKHYLHPNGNGKEEELYPVDIQSEIETILTLYQSKIKYGVEIVKTYDTDAKCLGNANQLNQVWINLLNNGLQAMNYQGRMEIVIEKKDSWIITSFIDSGTGISESIRGKIFDPFFTTKKHGEGIGLGLDICKKIIDKMEGKIEFETSPGRTKFSVWLKSADST